MMTLVDPYAPESWHDFFLAVAGAAAALTGLLFVALSLHIRYIVNDPTHRSMARGSLIGLVMVLILSLILLVRQPATWAGIELAAIGAVYLVVEGAYEAITIRRRRQVATGTILRNVLGQVLSLGGLIGGIGLILHAGPALYAVAFVAITVVVWNLWSAWELLIGVADDEIAQENANRPASGTGLGA